MWSAGKVGYPSRRTFKGDVQQGRSGRRAEAYPLGYVEGLNDARTKLAASFNVLLGFMADSGMLDDKPSGDHGTKIVKQAGQDDL